jgi:hypothetical protein
MERRQTLLTTLGALALAVSISACTDRSTSDTSDQPTGNQPGTVQQPDPNASPGQPGTMGTDTGYPSGAGSANRDATGTSGGTTGRSDSSMNGSGTGSTSGSGGTYGDSAGGGSTDTGSGAGR